MTQYVKMTAEEARAAHRQRRLERRLQRLAEPLPAPSVPGQLASNVLPLNLLDADLTVQVLAQVPDMFPGDELFLLWNGQEAGTRHVIDGTETYPLDLTLPVSFLAQEGTFTLQYQALGSTGQGGSSYAQTVIIDKTAPDFGSAGAPLVFEQAVEEVGVTPEYLAANNDHVKVTVPQYPDIALNDTLKLYWNTPTSGRVHALDIVTTQQHLDGGAIEAFIVGDFIRSHGEGPAETTYFMQDEAGNEGLESEPKSIQVFLTPLPTALPDPVVPLAADGMIDLLDAVMGVTVEIPQIVDARAGDFVVANWGGVQLPSVTINDPSAAGFPLEVAVSRTHLFEVGSGDVEVFYEFHRGEFVLASSHITVTVDIDAPGPLDPDPETPENEDLHAPIIRGAVSLVDNELTLDDANQDVTATIDFYENAQVDEVITLYWGQQAAPAATYTLTQTDVDAATLPPMMVPWAVVDAEGSGDAIEVRYTLSSASSSNEAQSVSALVKADLEVPGGPNGLAPAEFLNLQDNGWLIGNEGTQPFTDVKVPVYANMALDDIIDLKWVGNDAIDGTGNDIDGTEYTDQVVVTESHLADGWTTQVPFEPYIHLIKYGSARLEYGVTQNGKRYQAPEAIAPVDVRWTKQQ